MSLVSFFCVMLVSEYVKVSSWNTGEVEAVAVASRDGSSSGRIDPSIH